MGRYYAMDRDNRWERVARAYACLTGQNTDEHGVRRAASAAEAIERYYDEPDAENLTGDEFIAPTMIGESEEAALARRVAAHDAVVFYNYRGDRPRELCRAFVLPEFEGKVAKSPDSGRRGFDRGPKTPLRFVTMAAYAEDLDPYVAVAFPRPPKMVAIAGEVISDLGLTQFRCAETEKFPHVTFFFNDYRDDPFEGERREIVQSPRVDTYDKQPEMSAAGVLEKVLERLDSGDPEPFIVVNFANPDMVGHTGNLDAVVKAVETVDECVGTIVDRVLERGGSLIVTADHGNAEQMRDPEADAAHTSHTLYDVPLSVVGEPFKGRELREGGKLGDVVPTMFEMMGIEQPPEMTGESLLA
jgi:2,3-bisphosphoglycerate-independent phosphoglycerate mutase